MTEPIISTPECTEYTLTSGDAQITICAEKSSLRLCSLQLSNGTEFLPAVSDFPLPARVIDGDTETSLNWIFSRSEPISNTNSRSAHFYFVSESKGFSLDLVCRAYSTPGPFVFEAFVTNTASYLQRLAPGDLAALNLDCSGITADVWRISKESGWAEGIARSDGGAIFDGTGITKLPLKPGLSVNAWVNTEQNFNASGSFPLIFVDRGSSGLLMAMEWSCGLVACKSEDGLCAALSATLDNAGAKSSVFSTRIPSGDTLELPPVYILPYSGNVDVGSNIFKSWFLGEKAPKNLTDDPAEPLTQMDMQIGLEADSLNVDAIKWDYGWWSNDVLINWKTLEGSWQLRNSDYLGVLNSYGAGTMADFAALAHQRALSWTVYLLLHDPIGTDRLPTDAFGEFNSLTHPEWFSNRRIAEDMGLSADLGNRECVEFLKTELTKFFSENGIDTWRSDFEPINYFSDKENRHDENGTDVMYWCSIGFKELVTHLTESIKGFRYESCSSGGSMKDLYTATLATVINCDDSAHYLSLRTSFYDSSYVIHPAQLQIPCNSDRFNTDCETFFPNVTVSDESYDLHRAMLDMGYRSMVLGVPMFSSWTGTVLREDIMKYSTMYREKLRPLIRNGRLYHILPRPDGTNWDGVMYAHPDSKDAIKGAVFLFKPSETPGDTYPVVLAGLNPDTLYSLTFEDRPRQNFTATGTELMTGGFSAEIKLVGSEIIWITEAN